MRSLLVIWNPYPQAPEVSIVRTDTCTCMEAMGLGLTVRFPHISGSWVPFRLPCPETHPRAQPLRFEAPNAKNTSQTATRGMVHSGPAPRGGVV